MTKEDESSGKANYHSLLDRMRNLVHLHEAQFVCSLKEDDGGAWVQQKLLASQQRILTQKMRTRQQALGNTVLTKWNFMTAAAASELFCLQASTLRFEIQVITLDFTWFTTIDVVKLSTSFKCRIACRAPNHRYWCTLGLQSLLLLLTHSWDS